MLGLFVMAMILGILIVPIEVAQEGNIADYEDGVWWSITTITGVGYGDHYPVTTIGRVIGSILQVFGVVMFGTLIAVVSISMLRYQEDFYVRRIMERLDKTDDKIDEVKKHIDYLIRERMGEK